MSSTTESLNRPDAVTVIARLIAWGLIADLAPDERTNNRLNALGPDLMEETYQRIRDLLGELPTHVEVLTALDRLERG